MVGLIRIYQRHLRNIKYLENSNLEHNIIKVSSGKTVRFKNFIWQTTGFQIQSYYVVPWVSIFRHSFQGIKSLANEI